MGYKQQDMVATALRLTSSMFFPFTIHYSPFTL